MPAHVLGRGLRPAAVTGEDQFHRPAAAGGLEILRDTLSGGKERQRLAGSGGDLAPDSAYGTISRARSGETPLAVSAA